MNKKGWLSESDPDKMLDYLESNGKSSPRKFRLFACACARTAWKLIEDASILKAIELAEQFADGMIDRKKLNAAERKADKAKQSRLPAKITAEFLANSAGVNTAQLSDYGAATMVASNIHQLAAMKSRGADQAERIRQCECIRCLFGNPFRPVTLNRRWQSSTVLDLARTIYDEFPRQAGGYMKMHILADALMDSGCDSEEIIKHCRSDGPHVRGCFVVDLLLGKE